MSEAASTIVALRNQEAVLALPIFDEEVAYTLGTALRAKCLSAGAPIVIDIRTPSRRLFFAALPGSTPDNEDWARRKGNVALRCHASSMLTSENLKAEGRSQWPDAALEVKTLLCTEAAFLCACQASVSSRPSQFRACRLERLTT